MAKVSGMSEHTHFFQSLRNKGVFFGLRRVEKRKGKMMVDLVLNSESILESRNVRFQRNLLCV